MRLFPSWLVLLGSTLALALPQRHLAIDSPRIQAVVAFGDSYIDNGNGSFALTNHTWPSDPAYWHGRFSNGPTWPEHLSQLLTGRHALSDFAFGGATIDNGIVQGHTGYDSSIPVPAVRDQVSAFLASDAVRDIDWTRTLFVLDGGGNDAFFAARLGVPYEELARRTASSLLSQVQRLCERGATRLLIPSTPGLSASPYASSLNDSQRADLASFASEFSATLHRQWPRSLRAQVAFVNQSEVLFDSRLPNTTHACLTGVYPGVDDGRRRLCPRPEDFLYWDAYHPTAAGHRLLARQALTAIAVS
ncbi:unnamed protein product [Parajaminaea phylloscopi]